MLLPPTPRASSFLKRPEANQRRRTMSLSTISSIRAELSGRLEGIVPNPGVVANWVIEEAMRRTGGGDETKGLAAGAGTLPGSPELVAQASEFVDEIIGGAPVQYVLGHWSFRELDLWCDSRALIPRPETEVVVGEALSELSRIAGRKFPLGGGTVGRAVESDCGPGERKLKVVDLGTGTGAIALSIAKEGPRSIPVPVELEIWATDISEEAISLAGENLERVTRLQPHVPPAWNVRFAVGDWFSAILQAGETGPFDLIVSNPPYIANGDVGWVDSLVHHSEPRIALYSGETGLECLRSILDGAAKWLAPEGSLVMEIGSDQESDALECARQKGFSEAIVKKDLAGRPRVLIVRGRIDENHSA